MGIKVARHKRRLEQSRRRVQENHRRLAEGGRERLNLDLPRDLIGRIDDIARSAGHRRALSVEEAIRFWLRAQEPAYNEEATTTAA